MFQKELMLIKQRMQECMICHYWYFLGKGYKYEPEVCNSCHDISMKAYELENIAIKGEHKKC